MINVTSQIEHIYPFRIQAIHFIITKAIFRSVGNLAADFFLYFFGVFNKATHQNGKSEEKQEGNYVSEYNK